MRGFKDSFGMTLVELLISMAVLGVVLGIVIVVLDPLEQGARSRDAGRRNGVLQLTTGLQSYTANNGSYPSVSGWVNTLSTSNEIRTLSSTIEYKSGSPCSTNVNNNYCYNTNTTNAIIFVKLESKYEKQRVNCAENESAYYLWASGDDKSGVICSNGDPTAYSGYTYK